LFLFFVCVIIMANIKIIINKNCMVVEQYPGIDRAWEKKFFGQPHFSLAKLRAKSKAEAEAKYGEKPMSVEAARALLSKLKQEQKTSSATDQKMFLNDFLVKMENMGWSVDNVPANVFMQEFVKKIKNFPVTFVVKQNNGKELRAVAEQRSDVGEVLGNVLKNNLVFVGPIAQVEVYEGNDSLASHYIVRAPLDYPSVQFAVDQDLHQELGETYRAASLLYREKNYVKNMRDWMVELIAGMKTNPPVVNEDVLDMISRFLKVDSRKMNQAFLESQLLKVEDRLDEIAKELKEIRQAPENRTYLLVSEGEDADLEANA